MFWRRPTRTLCFLGLALLGGGCESGASSASASACSENEALVTWENWGAGFFAGYCRSCHSAGTPDRRGAPEGMDFETLEQVQLYRAAIEASVVDDETMPYGGGLPSEELARLQTFLRCNP